jgi:prevent-host-death family protein
MSHMKQVGVRELRRDASAILRRVAGGETIEVTDRGRPVAVILRSMPAGLDRLEREGLIRRAEGDLLRVTPFEVPRGAVLPSTLVAEGRDEASLT